MNVKKLEKLGWNIYPNMLIKEQDYPYCKAVVSVKEGKIKKVYWTCVGVPAEVKEKFMSELDKCAR